MSRLNREKKIMHIDMLFRDIHKKFIHHIEQRFQRQLTFAEFIFLRALYEVGSSNSSYLAKHLRVSMSHITNLCDKLIDKDLIFRRKSEQDRRILEIGLTEDGQHTMTKILAIRQLFLEDYFEDVSDEELHQLVYIYNKLHQRLSMMDDELKDQ